MRNRALVLTLLSCGGLALPAVGCGGDDGGPSDPAATGSIQVTATTTGDDPDADGYTVAMDGGASRNIASNGSTTLTSVAAGQHQVTLSGLAANCAVTGDNPVTASVSGGATASVSFQVVCDALTGFIQVSTSTSGDDLDPDGYTATLDGDADRSIGLNGVTTFSDVSVGQHQVELTGIADNCAVDVSNPASAAVTAGETAQVSFAVACDPIPVGSLEVTTSVTNNFDPDGYEVAVASVLRGAVDVEGIALFEDLPAGVQQVELRDIAPNCEVAGDNPATVDIPVGSTGTHTFSVVCTNPPDGRIVYWGDLSGKFGLIVMNADGSGRSLIFECGGYCRDPQWSPDGSRIAFADGEPPAANIYLINQDGSGLVQLTDSRDGFSRHPAWSPDGSRILFDQITENTCCPPARSLYVVSADGTGLAEIPRDDPMRVEDDAGWSPDGTQIAFTAHSEGYAEPGIYIMDAAGGTATKISEDPPGCDAGGEPNEGSWLDGFVGGRLEWSPDGARILFTRNYSEYSGGKCVPGSGWDDLLAMNPDGTDVAFVVENPDLHAINPSWSPNGSKIVYDGGDGTMHVVNADGTGDVAIPVGIYGTYPDWGP